MISVLCGLLLLLLCCNDVFGGPDLYAVMGITRDSTIDQIKSRYKKLARELHPDSTQIEDREKVRKQFIAVTEAYEILSDPAKRKQYDGTGYADSDQDNRQYLKGNLFSQNFDGVELDQGQLDAIWRNTHPDRPNRYAVFFWSSNYPNCIDAGPAWKQLASRLKGTSVRVASLRCDHNAGSCRNLGLNDLPVAIFFHDGEITRYNGKFEVQSLLDASLNYITLPKGVVRKVSMSLFTRCPVKVATLESMRSTMIHKLTWGIVTFEYSPCYDCNGELKIITEMMLKINPKYRVHRLNCEDLDSEVCEEYGRRDRNSAWSLGHFSLESYGASDEVHVKRVWFQGKKHSAAEYLKFSLQFITTSAQVVTSFDTIYKSEDAYAVAYTNGGHLGDGAAHFEIFAQAVLRSPIVHEKNKKRNIVIVAMVDCDKTPAVCGAVQSEGKPMLAIFPFGLKAKQRPPHIHRITDATQLRQAVERDAIPLRLYLLTLDNYHEKVVRKGPKAKPWFILFNAGTWCPPCNQIRNVWKKLAREAQTSTDPSAKKLRIAEVDCDTQKVLCRQVGIENYPSFMFYQGDTQKSFEGDRDAASLLEWAVSAVDNPVESPSSQEIMRIANDPNIKPYAILFNAGNWCPPCMEIIKPWKEFARMAPKDKFSGVGMIDCDQNQWVCRQFGLDGFPTVMLLRPSKSVARVQMPSSREKSLQLLLNFFKQYVSGL
eukprot:PhF_6_TR33701/c0_g1_i1/m.49450/K09530/DNAJC10; DnaJ homolog subfamily C member 10